MLTNAYCHNPINNPKHLKTTFVGVVLLSVRKKREEEEKPRPHHVITIKAVLRQPWKLSYRIQPFF
jgi:hypothetical protein